ncbi:Uncharacterised protein [Bordetella pertussis]|nr:Uncharacterised protein [Bordetella pertussis]
MLVPALERARLQIDGARLHVHDLDQQRGLVRVLEHVPVAALGQQPRLAQVQRAEHGGVAAARQGRVMGVVVCGVVGSGHDKKGSV